MDGQSLTALASRQHGLVTVAQARELGVTEAVMRRKVARGSWLSPVKGVLLLDPGLDGLRTRAAAATLVLPEAVISHATACRLHKLDGLRRWTPDEPVHVSLPRTVGRRQVTGFARHWSGVPEEQQVVIGGLTLTNIDRTLVDIAVSTDRTTAVCVTESALRKGYQLGDLDALARGRRGAARIASWWELADPRSANPLETRVRLPLVDAGLAPDELQYPVAVDGELIAVLDMAYRQHKVAILTDGRDPHLADRQFVHDRRQQILLQELGWVVLRFTWADTFYPAYIVQCVRRALEAAARRMVS